LILLANGARIPSGIQGFASLRPLHAGASSKERSIVEIGALVDCAGTAYWRREKAIEFPDDVRNLEAARELDRLAVEIAALEGSKLHALLDKFFEDEKGGLIAMPIISEILRQVSFSRRYDRGEELLQAIVDACSN
jgi:hypothetical protein